MDDEQREFLPPQPAGPEPELSGRPAPGPQAPPPTPHAPPPPPQAPPPSPQAPPPHGGWHQQPPPGWQQQPPPGWQQPPPPGWGYPPQPPQPDNGPAVAGFVLSLVSGGLLIVSFGLSTIISVGCAIFGLVYSRKGKRKVEAGETTKNAGLANAGWIISIISLVLSVLATLVYIVLVIALATDEEFRDDFENEFDNSDSIRASVRIAAAVGRLLLA
jgi:hypothetical protein